MKKKDSIIKGIVNSVLPVILAFAFGAIIIAAIGESPLETYGVLIRKSLLTEKGFMNTLHYASPHSDRACNCNYIQSKSV